MLSKQFCCVSTILLIFFSSICYMLEFKSGLMFALATTWLIGLLYSVKHIENRIVMLVFYITIFTFLMARLFIDDFASGYNSDYSVKAQSVTSYSKPAGYFIYYSITLSLAFVFLGYALCNRENKLTRIGRSVGYNHYRQRVKIISKRISYALYIFTIFTTLDMVMYIWANGYISYYLQFKPSLPHVFYTLDAAFGFAFFIFLACLPDKKEAKLLILLYLLRACLALLSGQRNGFILPVLFIIMYCFLRNSLSPNDLWIGKRGKILLLFSFPFLCALMFVVMLIRADNATGNESILVYFIDFFYSLGGSVNVLGYAYDLQASIPDGQNYTFGPLIRWFDSNYITELLGIGHKYENASVEMALNGHNLGSFLTYKINEYRYLHGGNLASSYIAELWLDYGFSGVAIGSFIYGCILGSILSFAKKNVWKCTIAFIMVYNIIYAPRASYLYFITECISYSFIVLVIYIFLRTRRVQQIIITTDENSDNSLSSWSRRG